MNKKGMILGIILLLSLAVVSHAADLKVRIIVDKASIRLKPDLTSQIIAQVPLGTILQAERKTGEWYKVNLPPNERGFIVSGYIHQSIVEEIVEKIPEEKPLVAPPPVPPPPALQVYVPKKVEIGPKSGIGIRAGYAMPSEEKYGSGLKYGANFCFGITKNIAIELSGLRFQSNVEEDPEALSKGKLSAIPIQLSIQGRFPINNQFVPYVLGGAGYYLNSFTFDEDLTDAWDALGFDIEEKVENTTGFHFGAGIDYFFTDNIALNADIRYCIVKTKGSWTITDQIGGTETSEDLEDLNLNSIMFGVGLKFFF
ncbi:MAG: OmpW family outer membrane protein [Candidatus Aminicenantia bacterium]